MNYLRIYNEFVADRRHKEIEKPYDRHHIVPKCLGGTRTAENVIKLCFSDHLFAHLLLARIYGGKLAQAFRIMLNRAEASHFRGKFTRQRYSWIREAHVAETRRWQTAAMSDPALRKRVSEKLKGRKKTAEHIARSVAGRRYEWITPEFKQKLSESHKGKKASLETRAKMSATHKANPYKRTQEGRRQASITGIEAWKIRRTRSEHHQT
jgi:hypothetical protein